MGHGDSDEDLLTGDELMLVGGVYVKDSRAAVPERYARRPLIQVERIIIHHVGPPGGNRDYTVAEIANYHMNVKGWPGIAYHFLAHPDGRLEYCGDMETIRYHAGLLNGSSVGICMAGDFSSEQPAYRQISRVRQLCKGISSALGREVEVVGHRDVSDRSGYGFTECPGNTWNDWRDFIAPRWMKR